jgi:hypothetical protein
VDADIACALLPEIPNEFDQPAVDHSRILKAGSGLALPHYSTVSRRLRREESSVLQ